MNKLVKSKFVYYLVTWIVFTGLYILIDIFRGNNIDFPGKIIFCFGMVTLMALFETLGNYSVFSRIKYLENDEITKPSVKGAISSVMVLSQQVDFARVKNEIASKWLITFSDDTSHVIKFRDKVKFFTNNWGAAAWLKFDSDCKTIHLEYFPMLGIQHKELAQIMRMEVEELFETYRTE